MRGRRADQLTGYLDAVHDADRRVRPGLTADDLDRVVDERWDPPVTLGVRLVSVVNDDQQHVGQAAYVRGLLDPVSGSAWRAPRLGARTRRRTAPRGSSTGAAGAVPPALATARPAGAGDR